MKKRRNAEKWDVIVNIILVVLEVIALCHDILAFGAGLFVWYTIDSNVLQLLVSVWGLYYVCRGREIPKMVTYIHFISAVGLTVTFLIAALVLLPKAVFHITSGIMLLRSIISWHHYFPSYHFCFLKIRSRLRNLL